MLKGILELGVIAMIDITKLLSYILDQTTTAIILYVRTNPIEKHGKYLGPIVSRVVKKCLVIDMESLIMLFKNTTYTQGFTFSYGCKSLPQ